MNEEKLIAPTIEHQNNMIINNSTNKTNKENDLILAGSDISIISADQDNDNDHHIQQKSIDTQKLSKDIYKLSSQNELNNLKKQKSEKNLNDLTSKISHPKQLESAGITSSQKRKNKIPINIIMGMMQLALSIILAALGCLVIARESTLAHAGPGLWAGAVAAIAGSLGVINIRRAQTAFLAVSLVCVATSTLAIALTGIGVVRDSNTITQEKVKIINFFFKYEFCTCLIVVF